MLVFCTFAAASTYKSFCGYEPPVVAICNYYVHVNGVHVPYIHKRSSAAGARADVHKGMSSMRLKTYIQSVVSLVQCLTEELHGFSDTVTMIT